MKSNAMMAGYEYSSPTMSNSTTKKEEEFQRHKTIRASIIFVLLLFAIVILVHDNVTVLSKVELLLQQAQLGSPTKSTIAVEEVPSIKPSSRSWNISIVVQLSGELGNHLSKLAFGYSIQRLLWDNYAIHSHLILQHQSAGKWLKARQDIQDCFPRFRSMDFTLGNTIEFQNTLRRQQQWLGLHNASQLVLPNLIPSNQVKERLVFLNNLLLDASNTNDTNLTFTNNISMPFLYAQSFVNWEYIDTYYHGLRSLFTFDNDACCSRLPEPDEHVFHFRNFLTELRRRGKAKGYQEIPPNQSVALFHSPTKVAITTRIHNEATQAYETAFSSVGWNARIVDNQTGTQDFCFLKHANYLVGGVRSTFAMWAALLGNATTVTLYSINCTETVAALGEAEVFLDYKFKTSELQSRIRFITVTPP